jgi:hypothetical protein
LDADAGSVTFYLNNTSQGTAFTGLTGVPYFFAEGSNGASGAFNFGQQGFVYTPPSGFVALNTYNLSTPTIPNGATQMAATLYTGTGAALTVANTVNGTNFQPDWVWIKSRSNAYNNMVYDVIRGAGKVIFTNSTSAEGGNSGDLLGSFNSNGFSVNTTFGGGSDPSTDGNGATYVAWQWKANGTGVSNTSGSITSTVSANTTAGFSVVTYTGTGANATVGHGLGVAPSMVITKKRSSTSDWGVYHTSIGNTNYLLLDTTAASAASSTYWNNTTPTSSVFSYPFSRLDLQSSSARAR